MPKRPDTKETVLLALELLRRVPRSHKVSAKDLYDDLRDTDLARDLRTIQRQLEMLAGHFGIERDERNKPYGYQWRKDAQGFSIPALTQQESLLLTLAEQHLRNLLPTRLMKTMDGFFTQARRNIESPAKSEHEREWLSKVRVVRETQPLLPPKIKSGIFETVSNALYNNNWLNIDYRNSGGHQENYDVMPLGLAQQGPRLYLVCRFRGFDNERSLALHRILSATASTLIFERPKEFDLQKYDNDGRFGFGEGKRIRLTFCIDKEAGAHLLETPLTEDQNVKELEDQYEISATVVDTAQLEWWLQGFGGKVTRIQRRRILNNPSI